MGAVRYPVFANYQSISLAELARLVTVESDFEALVHAPAALRRRGLFIADYEIDAA